LALPLIDRAAGGFVWTVSRYRAGLRVLSTPPPGRPAGPVAAGTALGLSEGSQEAGRREPSDLAAVIDPFPDRLAEVVADQDP
jgi:hypothetical protein